MITVEAQCRNCKKPFMYQCEIGGSAVIYCPKCGGKGTPVPPPLKPAAPVAKAATTPKAPKPATPPAPTGKSFAELMAELDSI